ncbi:glycosyltransferase family 2 protein [Oribacterium sp. C9]|uniref:glycosyltransferase family 2 protein n=1 Tax=Oribacterium sp. C9 TaxID=1943579 RepID=UPI00098E9EDB|nr:glycosyltransferase family 2 protein [Oribacterium sp. C9]
MIAILLASYNGEKYIEEQILSIINQMDQVDEACKIFIHDDGSSDGTTEIISKLEKCYPDRINVLEAPPCGGSTKNFMFMLEKVEADYYMFADQDDVWLDTKIKKQFEEIKRMEIEKSVEYPLMVFSDMKVVAESLETINESFYTYSNLNPYRSKLNELILENVVSGCCMLFNRSLRNLAIMYTDINKIKWHDWWITEVASAVDESNGNIVYIDEPLMLYRQHGYNSVGAIDDLNSVRIKKKLKMVIGGEQSKETRIYIREAIDQVKQLDNLGNVITSNACDIIRYLKKFDAQSKIQKIISFRKYKISRDKRNIWMMLHL